MTIVVSNVNLTTNGNNRITADATTNSIILTVNNTSQKINSSSINVGSISLNSTSVYSSGSSVVAGNAYAVGEYVIVSSVAAQPANTLLLNTSYTRTTYPAIAAQTMPHIDSSTWTARSMTPTTANVNHMVFGNNKFVGTGTSGANKFALYSSDSGTTWANAGIFTNISIGSLVYGNGYFILTKFGGSAGSVGHVQRSIDGQTWDADIPLSGAILSIAYGNGVFSTYTSSSGHYSTDNGVNWNSITGTVPVTIADSTWANGKFIVSGFYQTGSVGSIALTSDNGATWTRRDTTLTSSLTGVTAGQGKIVVVSQNGNMAISEDEGVTWNLLKNAPIIQGGNVKLKYFSSCNLFFSVAPQNLFMSHDAYLWERLNQPFSVANTLDIAFGQNVFVGTGVSSNIATSNLFAYNITTNFKIPPLSNLPAGYTAYVRYQ